MRSRVPPHGRQRFGLVFAIGSSPSRSASVRSRRERVSGLSLLAQEPLLLRLLLLGLLHRLDRRSHLHRLGLEPEDARARPEGPWRGPAATSATAPTNTMN